MYSGLKIDFGHQIGDAATKLDDLNVIGVNCVSVEHRAISKDGSQTRVVRPGRVQRVETDRKALNSRHDGGERSQTVHMILASCLRGICTILPNYDVGQHVL